MGEECDQYKISCKCLNHMSDATLFISELVKQASSGVVIEFGKATNGIYCTAEKEGKKMVAFHECDPAKAFHDAMVGITFNSENGTPPNNDPIPALQEK